MVDAWERTYETSQVGQRPLLVLYEDKASSSDNKAFKDELSKLAKGDAYKTKVVLLAVADLTGYDYWPTRGFVKDAVRDESRKAGTPIYCDWDGSIGRALSVKRGASNVMLYGKDGKVLFSYEGAMPEASRKELLELLRQQVEE
jgi:predicted transcriptional regulator